LSHHENALAGECENGRLRHQIHSSCFTFGNKNKEEEILKLENVEFSVLFTPGHSPGSVSFYAKALNMLISGDVLFQRSIGRTDLPGGDMETLLTSIRNQLFVLPDETIVYSGHGHFTTIGDEKAENPFFS
jgi:glyoxylase-like metal-dependent hydrolase (beta-lactamase superfamily II)